MRAPVDLHLVEPFTRTCSAEEELEPVAKTGFAFRRQLVVGPFIADFACTKFRLVVEIDGPYHEDADRFGRTKVNFVDLAGNCHLEVGDRYYAHIEGRRPESKPSTARALRGPAYQVLFALLADPDLTTAPARVLADAAGKVSPQTALDARRRFRDRGLLVGPPDALQWTPRGYRQGLDTFLAGFADTLAAGLIVGRYRARQRDVRDLEEGLTPRLDASVSWRWGGGAACERLTEYYRGDTTVIYVDDARPKLAADLQLAVDRQGPITIMRAPGPLAFDSPKSDTVHPLLAWADLLVEGDERATEAAGEIYNRYLARPTP